MPDVKDIDFSETGEAKVAGATEAGVGAVEYDEEALRIVGITLVETEVGEYDPVLEFGTFHSGTANP